MKNKSEQIWVIYANVEKYPAMKDGPTRIVIEGGTLGDAQRVRIATQEALLTRPFGSDYYLLAGDE